MPELERYAADSDLVVVAAGKGPVSQLFERDAARSPYDTPMRALSLVFANGVKPLRRDMRDGEHSSPVSASCS